MATILYHPNGNAGVKPLGLIAHMLSIVVSKKNDHWNEHLSKVELVHNNSISAASGDDTERMFGGCRSCPSRLLSVQILEAIQA